MELPSRHSLTGLEGVSFWSDWDLPPEGPYMFVGQLHIILIVGRALWGLGTTLL